MGGNTVSNWQVKDDTGPSVKVLERTMQTGGKSLRSVSNAAVTGELLCRHYPVRGVALWHLDWTEVTLALKA